MDTKTIKTIQRICKYLSEKYTFGYYSKEDIEQEGFIIALEALPRFDARLSTLDTFLYIHISNKLKTFKRDHYQRTDFVCSYCGRKDPLCEHCQRREWKHAAKKHLMEPIDIDNVNDNIEKNMYTLNDPTLALELKEVLCIINQNLDISLREDYLKMLEGIFIPKNKRTAIEQQIIQILEDKGYYLGRK